MSNEQGARSKEQGFARFVLIFSCLPPLSEKNRLQVQFTLVTVKAQEYDLIGRQKLAVYQVTTSVTQWIIEVSIVTGKSDTTRYLNALFSFSAMVLLNDFNQTIFPLSCFTISMAKRYEGQFHS